LRQH
jgi:hypothetical protein